jgi:GldL N-terminal domain
MRRFDLLNFFYGLGAAVILIAALFKFVGWKGADTLFMVGLIGEAIIFIISGIQPVNISKIFHWERVFPQLRESGDDESITREIPLGAAQLTQEQQIQQVMESISSLNNSVEILNKATQKLSTYVENLESNYELVSNSTLDYHKEINSLKIKIASANEKLREFENFKF